MFTLLGTLGSTIIGGIIDHFKGKQAVKAAVVQNKIRLAQSEQSHNQDWEMKQLDNAGWKDDVLFYAFIVLFVWTGFDPTASHAFFVNLAVLPGWVLKTWFWLLAGVLGVKKIGDYGPALVSSLKQLVSKEAKK